MSDCSIRCGFTPVPLCPTPAPENTVNGTSGNDVVHISKAEGLAGCLGLYRVSVNGECQYMTKQQLENTNFKLGAGNDLLVVDPNVDVNIKCDGGAGDDLLIGGKGDDQLSGNDGNDLILGGAGHDKIDGGKGNDWLFGGSGNDTIHGGKGNDVIFGGLGNDRLYGDKGRDYIDGGWGNDVIRGGRGNDTLVGGPGLDDVRGGRGRDRIYDGLPLRLIAQLFA